MNEQQRQAVLYAYLDLKGALQAIDNDSPYEHDWDGARKTLKEMAEAFDFVGRAKVRNIETGEVHFWNLKEVLKEINRDRSGEWIEYDETDWVDGWNEWVEGHTYQMIENTI